MLADAGDKLASAIFAVLTLGIGGAGGGGGGVVLHALSASTAAVVTMVRVLRMEDSLFFQANGEAVDR